MNHPPTPTAATPGTPATPATPDADAADLEFDFEFDPTMARAAAVFGVRPDTTGVTLSADEMLARFGPWTLRTELANVAEARVSGPYRWWRVAGPAHLSLADRGVTFATTTTQGVCLAFSRSVPAVEPTGRITHPSLTVTVADAERFLTALAERGVTVRPPADPSMPQGEWPASVAAVLGWYRRRSSIRTVDHEVTDVDVPAPAATDTTGARTTDPDTTDPNSAPDPSDTDPSATSDDTDRSSIDDGVGPRFHRRYQVRVDDPALDAEGLMAKVHADPNVVAPGELGPFVKQQGEHAMMAVGDRFLVNIRGPWRASVEVVGLGPTWIRLATLDGHTEAGEIEFRALDTGDTGGPGRALVFRIDSWATSADPAFHVLYDVMGVGRALQGEMWVRTCEAVAAAVGGTQRGAVDVVQHRAPA